MPCFCLQAPLRVHALEWAGQSVADKLAGLRRQLAEEGAGALLVTMLGALWLSCACCACCGCALLQQQMGGQGTGALRRPCSCCSIPQRQPAVLVHLGRFAWNASRQC